MCVQLHSGGGGGTSYVLVLSSYDPRERPPLFNLNLHSGAYHFYKCKKKNRSRASPFLVARQIFFLPFRRPSFSKCISVQAVTRYILQFIAARGQPECQPDIKINDHGVILLENQFST